MFKDPTKRKFFLQEADFSCWKSNLPKRKAKILQNLRGSISFSELVGAAAKMLAKNPNFAVWCIIARLTSSSRSPASCSYAHDINIGWWRVLGGGAPRWTAAHFFGESGIRSDPEGAGSGASSPHHRRIDGFRSPWRFSEDHEHSS